MVNEAVSGGEQPVFHCVDPLNGGPPAFRLMGLLRLWLHFLSLYASTCSAISSSASAPITRSRESPTNSRA